MTELQEYATMFSNLREMLRAEGIHVGTSDRGRLLVTEAPLELLSVTGIMDSNLREISVQPERGVEDLTYMQIGAHSPNLVVASNTNCMFLTDNRRKHPVFGSDIGLITLHYKRIQRD